MHITNRKGQLSHFWRDQFALDVTQTSFCIGKQSLNKEVLSMTHEQTLASTASLLRLLRAPKRSGNTDWRWHCLHHAGPEILLHPACLTFECWIIAWWCKMRWFNRWCVFFSFLFWQECTKCKTKTTIKTIKIIIKKSPMKHKTNCWHWNGLKSWQQRRIGRCTTTPGSTSSPVWITGSESLPRTTTGKLPNSRLSDTVMHTIATSLEQRSQTHN